MSYIDAVSARHSSEHVEHYTPEWLVEKARTVLGGFDLDPASSEFANRVVRAPTIFTLETNGLLQPEWRGRVILNPPGGLVDGAGRPVYRKTKLRAGCDRTGACGLPPGHAHEGVTSSAVVWWRALVSQWTRGHVTSAFFVGFSIELLQSCQRACEIHPLDFPCCFPKDRLKFDTAEWRDGELVRVSGDQPTHSNVLVFLPSLVGNLAGSLHGYDPQMIDRFCETFKDVGYFTQGK